MGSDNNTTIRLRLRPGFNLHGRAALVEATDDELLPVLQKGHRPAKRAVAMANALMFEHSMMAGRFPSVTEACKAYGITRRTAQRFFALLNQPPEKIVAMLYEVY